MKNMVFALGMPGMGELLVVLLIVLILFGGSKIPEIARSIGQGIAEFKKSIGEDKNGKKK